MKVTERIKVYLVKKNIKQNSIATAIKMSPSKLNLSLNGKRRLALEEYIDITKALKVELDTFTDDSKYVQALANILN